MLLTPGQTVRGTGFTQGQSGLANADTLPTVIVIRNGAVDNAVTATITNLSDGFYTWSLALPITYLSTDDVRIVFLSTITINGITISTAVQLLRFGPDFYAVGATFYALLITTGQVGLQPADLLPTGNLYRNGVLDGTPTVIISALQTGIYTISGAVPAYAGGDSVAVIADSTIDTLTTAKDILDFVVLAAGANAPTIYPFRQALTFGLRQIVLNTIAPPINAAIERIAASISADPTQVPTFGDSTIVTGDLNGIEQPTICIFGGRQEIDKNEAVGMYIYTFYTSIMLKLAPFGDNDPEIKEAVSTIFTDNTIDCFNSLTNYYLKIVDPTSGLNVLPDNAVFTDCHAYDMLTYNTPITTANGVLKVPAYEVKHVAIISVPLQRATPVGG